MKVTLGKPSRRAFVRSFTGMLGIAIVLLTGAHRVATAADDYYIVEVIVFEHTRGGYSVPADGYPATDGAVRVADGDAAFQVIGNEELRLQDVWLKLKQAPQYRPMFHKGWLQPGLAKAQARPARIQSRAGVDGTIRVYRSRYLHLDADLLLGGDGRRFRIKESRRMRSRELHYLDHPRFGLLVMITPA